MPEQQKDITMKESPITAIVVLYFSKHLIGPLLANITEKIAKLDEIILVDNSGEDLSEFESSLVRVTHPSKNIGYGAAINYGVKIARNENIIAMNPDVWLDKFDFDFPSSPAEKVILSGKPIEWSNMRRYPTLTYDFLRFALFNLTRQFQWIGVLNEKINLEGLESPILVDWVSGAFILTNKKTMTHIGGFDEEYFLFYEELDLCKRAELETIPRYITPDIQFRLNQGTSSATNVSKIKLTSEMHSAKRYHTKYSGRALTRCIFFMLKIYCYSIWKSLEIIGTIIRNPKIKKKQLQYKTYADAI